MFCSAKCTDKNCNHAVRDAFGQVMKRSTSTVGTTLASEESNLNSTLPPNGIFYEHLRSENLRIIKPRFWQRVELNSDVTRRQVIAEIINPLRRKAAVRPCRLSPTGTRPCVGRIFRLVAPRWAPNVQLRRRRDWSAIQGDGRKIRRTRQMGFRAEDGHEKCGRKTERGEPPMNEQLFRRTITRY